jgi:hypothetical protein
MLKPMFSCLVRKSRTRRARRVSPFVAPLYPLEPLEDRLLLTSTIFMDFGGGVGAGGSFADTVANFRDIFGANTGTNMTNGTGANPTGLLGADTLTFSPLNFDFDLDLDFDNDDITGLANAVVAIAADVLLPFDINVVVASATSLADAVALVGANDGDGYAFNNVITASGSQNGSVGNLFSLFGRAAALDLGAQTGNNNDEAVQIYTDNILGSTTGLPGTAAYRDNFVQRLAYTSIHEIYHTYSARHTPDESNTNPQASANQRLLASGDVIRRGSNTRENPFIVTRYDLQRAIVVTEPNNYLMTANDANLGLRDDNGNGTPDMAYSTGTGAHDVLDYTNSGGGIVGVNVNPFSDSAHTSSISSESYNIDLSSDTDGLIRIDASINADDVNIDGDIAATFEARGGTGMDPGAAEADLLTLSANGLTGSYNVATSTATYAGGATINFSQFENVEADGIPVVLNTPSLSENVINEGDTITLSGSFVNIDTLDSHTVTVSWGDGTSDTVVVLAPGVREYSINHTYQDDNPTGTASDINDITITITDGDDGTGTDSLSITVNNVAPVVSLSSVAMINENESATLAGTITDPGILDDHNVVVDWDDPNDASDSTFSLTSSSTLSVGDTFNSSTDSAVLTVTSVDLASGEVGFSVQHLYLDDGPAPGNGTTSDTETIVVTATDDDTGQNTAETTVLVKNVAPTITGFESDATFEDKGEEGEPVTVTGTVTDPGLLDEHNVVVVWGDPNADDSTFSLPASSTLSVGDTVNSSTDSAVLTVTSVDLATGEVGFSAQHVYNAGGIFEITITITDDDTGQDNAETIAVVTGVGLYDGTLWIIGTNDVGPDGEGDRAHVHQVGHNFVKVHADFIPEPSRTFELADVEEVIAYLCDGDDHFTMSGRTALPTVVHGGDGNDKLQGGRGQNVLLGEAGDDKLGGKRGSDLLIGGAGEDMLLGQTGDDILTGGSVDGVLNDDALLDILGAWADVNKPEAERLILVNLGFLALNHTDDGDVDRLNGGPGADLFFEGVGDLLKPNSKSGDVVQII